MRSRILAIALSTAFGVGLSNPPPAAAAEVVFVYTGLRFEYTKNGCVATGCTTNAQLKYTYQSQKFEDGAGYPPSTISVTWRGGSGTNKNSCDVGDGWIPNTDVANTTLDNDYSLSLSDPHNGSAIFGTAWYIRNGRYGGAPSANCDTDSAAERTELFIHSEMTNSHTQTNCGVGDSPTCWEGTNDYHSDGCIKVSFGNIWGAQGGTSDTGTVKWYWNNRGGKNGIPLIVRN